jgi:hypothetical protein
MIVVGGLSYLTVSFQIFGHSPDWESYDEFFDLLRTGLTLGIHDRFEPGFVFLSENLINFFSSNYNVLALLAVLSILIKTWSIGSVASSWLALYSALIFYVFRFAPLHEYTQIRVAIAISLIFLATAFAIRKKTGFAISCSLMATSFHMTAFGFFAILPFVSFSDRLDKLLTIKNVFLLGLVSLIASKFLVELLVGSLEGHIAVVHLYQESGFGGIEANPLSLGLVLDMLMIGAFMTKWSRLSNLMKIFLYTQALGIVFFYGAIQFPVVAFRVREFLGVFWVFFIILGMENNKIRPLLYFLIASNFFLYTYLYFVRGTFF